MMLLGRCPAPINCWPRNLSEIADSQVQGLAGNV